MTLTEFLLARIAEDERNLPRLADPLDFVNPDECDTRWGERVRAECEAKRARIDHYKRISRRSDGGPLVHEEYLMAEGAVRKQLMFDAAVYADHPDYRDEWRP